MKLFQRTKSKITKDENDKNVPHLEITEHFNIVANDFDKIQEFCLHLYPMNRLFYY